MTEIKEVLKTLKLLNRQISAVDKKVDRIKIGVEKVKSDNKILKNTTTKILKKNNKNNIDSVNKAIFSKIESTNDKIVKLLGLTADIWKQAVFVGPVISNVNLSGIDLEGINLQGATISNVNLSNTNLKHADLRHATLTNVNLSNTNKEIRNLYGAKLNGANLKYVNLSRADLSNSKLNKATFSGVNFHLTKLHNADLTEINLRDADLSNTSFIHGDIQRDDQRASDLPKFKKALLVRVKFPSSVAGDKFGAGPGLSGVNFEGADLRYAQFPESTILQRANFNGAKLSHAKLPKAQLQGANLRRANLSFADFDGVNLNGASLPNSGKLYRTHFHLARMVDTSFPENRLTVDCKGRIYTPRPFKCKDESPN